MSVPSLLVGVSPASSSAGGSTPPHLTPAVTASASGGSGSYTYSWVVLIESGGLIINSPASAGTSFRFSLPDPGLNSALVRVTATDTASGYSASKDVVVEFNYFEWDPFP